MGIFIIAEVGINHNGDIDIAKELIKVARDAGCDAVKFQKRTVEVVYSKELLDSPRESPWGNTQRAQKTALEFGAEQYQEIDRYCRELGIDWFASAWDPESQRFLRRFGCKFNKIASAMVPHEELLKMVAEEKKHTFISTGMSSLEQIDRAVEIFRLAGCPFELLHCKSTYPLDDEDANLRCIDTLRSRYRCRVGYSGHEQGLSVSYAAAAFGISSLERHITLNRAMYGSDQAASLEPLGLRTLVGAVRKIEKALGDGVVGIHPKEIPISKKLRGHFFQNGG
ncbi:MAG: N-acetylneuraminate synthase family protein [Elusimicrobiota bacterium]